MLETEALRFYGVPFKHKGSYLLYIRIGSWGRAKVGDLTLPLVLDTELTE